MARWDYNLGIKGQALRDYINEGNSSKEHCEVILKQIVLCCEHLKSIITDDDKEWYEWDLAELIQDCEDTKDYLDEDDDESNEDNINDVLTTFYDLMDSMRVWVAL